MAYQREGMHLIMTSIVNVLRADDELVKLLYFLPKNLSSTNPVEKLDPLDRTLPTDIIQLSAIRDDRIKQTYKQSDYQSTVTCKILVYAGRRVSNRNSYLIADQEIVIDILSHNDYEKDYRSTRISDRLNELLVDKRIVGFGAIRYVDGVNINAPNEYSGYRTVFEVGAKGT